MYVNFCPIETNYSFSQINKAKFNQSPDWAEPYPTQPQLVFSIFVGNPKGCVLHRITKPLLICMVEYTFMLTLYTCTLTDFMILFEIFPYCLCFNMKAF